MKRPKRHYRHMTPLAAEMMRQLYFVARLKQREIAHMFGVGQNTVSRVVSDQVWVR